MSRTGATFTVESKAPAALARSVAGMERACNRIAIAWHAAARQAAPVDLGRLRASIAFATHTNHPPHTGTYPGARGRPGGTIAYDPPDPGRLTVTVGSNVEYAPAVHEGLPARTETVRAHSRRMTQAFGRPITPRIVQVGAFERNAPARAPLKFIEGPGRYLVWRYREIVLDELKKLEGDS